MKITNNQLINMLNNIEIFKKKTEEKVIPLKISFAVTRNKRTLEEEYKNYVEELIKLNSHYNVIPSKEGIDVRHLAEEDRKEYSSKLEELLGIEIEISLQTVKEEDFGTYEPTFKEVDLLSFMLDI